MSDTNLYRLRITWGNGQLNTDDYPQDKFEGGSFDKLVEIKDDIIDSIMNNTRPESFYELKTKKEIINYRLNCILQIIIYPDRNTKS